MLVINLNYKKDIDEVEKHLEEHKDFLKKQFKAGIFIASGAKVPRTGGIILADTTYSEAEQLIQSDPFYREGIADYELIEFSVAFSHDLFVWA